MFQKLKRFFTYFRVVSPYLDDIVLWLSLVKDFPSVQNEESLRSWTKKVVVNAQVIAGTTSITLDDQALDILYKIINSNDTWNILYSLIQMMTGEEKQCGTMDKLQLLTEKTEAMVAIDSDEKVENPAILILSIVGFVLQVITFIKNQREKTT